MPANNFPFSSVFRFAAMVLLLVGVAIAVSSCGGGDGLKDTERYGVVRLTGPIADVRDHIEWMQTLRRDDDVVGVLVRIDSPGGVAGPSQELYSAMVRLAKVKPVVVSMGALCASGGYYMACPATHIIANPSTLTGSIGVRMELANLMELMDHLGIRHTSVTSGQYKGTPSPFRNMTDDERIYIESLVMDLHDQFTSDILAVRPDLEGALDKIADGRILTGRQALDAGLVDALGGEEDAMDWLQAETGKGRLPTDTGPKDTRNWVEKLLDTMADANPAALLQAKPWRAVY